LLKSISTPSQAQTTADGRACISRLHVDVSIGRVAAHTPEAIAKESKVSGSRGQFLRYDCSRFQLCWTNGTTGGAIACYLPLNARRISLMCVGSFGMVKTGGGCGIRAISFITMTRAINRSTEIHLLTWLAFSRESGDSDRSPEASLIMWAILLRSGSSFCSRTRLNRRRQTMDILAPPL
jgi:hypothetical protein